MDNHKDNIVEMPAKNNGQPTNGDWVDVEDDGCRWILDLPGGPFAVLPCNICKTPVEIESTPDLKHHRVRCPVCGKKTPEVIGGQLLDALELWNEMVVPKPGSTA